MIPKCPDTGADATGCRFLLLAQTRNFFHAAAINSEQRPETGSAGRNQTRLLPLFRLRLRPQSNPTAEARGLLCVYLGESLGESHFVTPRVQRPA